MAIIGSIVGYGDSLTGIISSAEYITGQVVGLRGLKGDDGYSPSATVTKDGSTATITITDKDGTTTASITEFSGDYDDLTNKPSIPTKVSDLTNDSGYLTEETDPVFTSSDVYGITSSDISSWNAKSDFSGDYDDLTNKPSIPTKVSDLSNDSGYLTLSTLPIYDGSVV